jgi:hypothetical protein
LDTGRRITRVSQLTRNSITRVPSITIAAVARMMTWDGLKPDTPRSRTQRIPATAIPSAATVNSPT